MPRSQGFCAIASLSIAPAARDPARRRSVSAGDQSRSRGDEAFARGAGDLARNVRAPLPTTLVGVKTFECLRSDSSVATKETDPPIRGEGVLQPAKYEAAFHRAAAGSGHRITADGAHPTPPPPWGG